MKMTITQLRKTVLDILATHPIYGAQDSPGNIIERVKQGWFDHPVDIYLAWDQAWVASASLRISIKVEEVKTVDHNGSPVLRKYFRTCCDIGWSSTGRSVQGATAAVALYRKVIDLAALIQAATDGNKVDEEEKEITK